MPSSHCHLCGLPSPIAPAAIFALFLALGTAVHGQAPGLQPKPGTAAQNPAPRATQNKPTGAAEVRAIKEDELKQQLQGKTFYLRGGFLENELHFDRQGNLEGNSPRASFTLSMVQIDRVSLSKHKLQLVGIRYGLHFLGGDSTEDPIAASDRVRITPKKKFLRITIDRVEVVGKKKSKGSKGDGKGTGPSDTLQPLDPNQSLAQSAAAGERVKIANPEEPVQVTQAQANQFLKEALDHILSQGLDDRMIASLPDFWRLYYQAAAAKANFKPADPSVLRQNGVDQKARLLSNFEPPSNDFAQEAGVAGVAQYHVVVGADGKPGEIAVGRPIGFGLDENAVASIRNASFQPAIKNGKPVPVLLDLLVQFRIYSKRTGVTGSAEGGSATLTAPESPSLPGPYSASEAPTRQQ